MAGLVARFDDLPGPGPTAPTAGLPIGAAMAVRGVVAMGQSRKLLRAAKAGNRLVDGRLPDKPSAARASPVRRTESLDGVASFRPQHVSAVNGWRGGGRQTTTQRPANTRQMPPRVTLTRDEVVIPVCCLQSVMPPSSLNACFGHPQR